MKPQLTIEAFADWASKKPADEAYNYCCAFNCAFCQFLREAGFSDVSVNPVSWKSGDVQRELPAGLNELVQHDGNVSSWTFGALAARLRDVQP